MTEERGNESKDRALGEWFTKNESRLIGLARKLIQENRELGRQIDPEDVVQSMMRGFIKPYRERYYEKSHSSIWKIAYTAINNKVLEIFRRKSADKRTPGRTVERTPDGTTERVPESERGESVFGATGKNYENPSSLQNEAKNWDGRTSDCPDAELEFKESLERVLKQLPDDDTRNIALLHFEGYTPGEINDKIGEEIGLSESSIRRKINDIIEPAVDEEIENGDE